MTFMLKVGKGFEVGGVNSLDERIQMSLANDQARTTLGKAERPARRTKA